MHTVAVRPRLDRRYDVIQDVVPQFLGAKDTKEEAIALALKAAKRHAPAKVIVFGNDGARIEEERLVEA